MCFLLSLLNAGLFLNFLLHRLRLPLSLDDLDSGSVARAIGFANSPKHLPKGPLRSVKGIAPIALIKSMLISILLLITSPPSK
jgi:hypothetical protein